MPEMLIAFYISCFRRGKGLKGEFSVERIMHFVFLKLFSFFGFISVFVSLGFPSSGNLFFFYFSLHLKFSYSVLNFIFLIQT